MIKDEKLFDILEMIRKDTNEMTKNHSLHFVVGYLEMALAMVINKLPEHEKQFELNLLRKPENQVIVHDVN